MCEVYLGVIKPSLMANVSAAKADECGYQVFLLGKPVIATLFLASRLFCYVFLYVNGRSHALFVFVCASFLVYLFDCVKEGAEGRRDRRSCGSRDEDAWLTSGQVAE